MKPKVLINKIILIIIVIIITTITVWQINQYFEPPVVENMADSGGVVDKITAPFTKAIDFLKNIDKRFAHIQHGFDDLGKGLKDEFVAFGNSLSYMGTDFANIMSAAGNYVPPFVGSAINAEVDNINVMFSETNQSFGAFFKSLPEIADPYLIDTEHHDGTFDRLYRYVKMYMNCGGKFAKNILFCLFFYMLDILFEMLKIIFIHFPTFLIEISIGYDLSSVVNKGFDGFVMIDEACFSATGFHCFFYSDTVLNSCYYCDGIPHKGRHDNPMDSDPTMPGYSPPDFPQDVNDAVDNLKNTYNNIIPGQLRQMGRFLGNTADPSLTTVDYRQNVDNMNNGFGKAVSTAANHFSNEIPSQFATATQDFNNVGVNFNKAFSDNP